MAEQRGTEPPSRRKLEKARERGEGAFSKELVSAVASASALVALVLVVDDLGARLLALARRCLGGGSPEEASAALSLLARGISMVGGAAALGALLACLLQVGVRFRFRWSLARLNPAQGFRQMVGPERWVDTGLLALKMAVLMAVGVVCVWPGLRAMALQAGAEPSRWIDLGGRLLLRLLMGLSLCSLGLAVLDFVLQRRRHRRRLRMTREEVLRERKEQEGDPQLRAERRRRHRQLLLAGGFGLRQASVLVVNPTHLAVGLRYQDGDDAPVVVASGRDGAAAVLRLEARRFDIPVIEHVPLARALIGLEVGTPIPESLYLAVAAVIRTVRSLQQGEDRRTRDRPPATTLPVPRSPASP